MTTYVVRIVCGYSRRDGVCDIQRGHSGDGCDLSSNLCMYDLRKGDLFILSWVPCGSGAFSLEEGRIAPLPLPRYVVRGDYLECLAK